ncbi:hypothetical protein HELRODRAFT_170572 [Helobdella robusta]|uniref:Voltage-dependent calcium channel alpha-2/delta subunit conserved region domain-containing protein n=1 Tax=Helobdella robusta TaxID=6412 RepID=T1F370_HELRO|nr:hypothetical protein HELRODRAFT_170572 [Helobdella robusta]ESO07248.1 hypothetical protein HELRODRAFT_170572 [Helobdella robusta]
MFNEIKTQNSTTIPRSKKKVCYCSGDGSHNVDSGDEEVSQAVYDKRPEMNNMGVLLGVMGTDIPLDEMTKHFPAHKIGVNGYPFAITPNGYTLFHPRLKPRQPNLSDDDGAYNAVDLSDLEVSDVEHMQRAKERDSTYFYTDVKRTPFSVAISLPNKYGHYKVENIAPIDFNGEFRIILLSK